MEQNISTIKDWLGTGSINIFGLPFSGKDTVGIRLAEDLGAKFLSSGLILRHIAEEDQDLAKEMKQGLLADTNKFLDSMLPYLSRQDLQSYPLVLSSVGRWEGEEYPVIEAAEDAGHPIKAVILLNISEAEAKKRWQTAKTLMDRGEREDDKESSAFDKRIDEFIQKTMPVIETYQKRGVLVSVPATADREAVYQKVIEELAIKAHEIDREII
jgi:adenylate kinase family enzyme